MAETIDPRWAWEPFQPSAKSPWDLKKVGHLYRRAAFGATWDEMQAGLQDGPDKTIQRLLAGQPGLESFESQTVPLERSTGKANNGPQASAWWLYRMLYSPHPLREKMTLFWHNHFATSNAKVRNAGFMLGQYDLMYQHALGNFATLLQEMSKDAGMLVWLDTSISKKGMPNENYARELMELFSLGIGNYTENDIREAAKAFTGWRIENGKAVFKANEHDDGSKTVLGQTGKWQGSNIVRICLEQKSAPYFICGKLYRYLVSETVPASPELLAPLADDFRASNYDFGALVARVLRSNLFFAQQVYRTRVKPPVDYVLGIVRALEGHVGSTALAQDLAALGQDLFQPPSVKGWDSGAAWLDGHTLLFRQNLALAMTSTTDDRFGRRIDPAALTRKHSQPSEGDLVDFFVKLLLQGDVPAETRQQLSKYSVESRKQPVPIFWSEQDSAEHRVRALCHLVMSLPEYQLS